MRRSATRILLFGAVATGVLGSALIGWTILDQTRAENARQERLSQMQGLAESISRQGINSLSTMTRDLSGHARGALSGNSDSVAGFLARMEGEMKIGSYDLGFLLDSTGVVRQRRQDPGELDVLGKDLSFRRYFVKGRSGRDDLFGAVGAFTNHRGIYGSAPVQVGSRFFGVVVARLSAEEIERTWFAGLSDPVALVSPEGVVLASNKATWRLTCPALSDSAIGHIRDSRQFGDSIHPLEIDLSKDDIRWQGRTWSVVRADVGQGWVLAGLLPGAARSPLTRPQDGAAWSMALAWSLLALLGVLVALGLQRIGRVERERGQLARRLDDAQRLESLGRLAGGVAHDFNNVLTAIIGYSSVLEHRLSDRPKDQDMVRRIGQAARRASETVHQLMTFARRSDLKVRPLSLHDLIREVAGLLEHTLPRGIRVVLDLQATRDVVQGDTSHLHQVLLNLAINSRDAMPEGGLLRFSTRNRESASGPGLELLVSDSGAGIPQDILPHVFEPFFTTKSGGRGTGLGLASVWGAIQRHGGSISVRSAPGTGTEFAILLALAPEGVEGESRPPDTGRIHLRRGLSLVVLDDDVHVLDAISTMAQSLGHRIELCSDYRSLRSRLQSAELPDLLVLDLDMPDMPGQEVLRAVHAEHPDLPVLIASGHTVSETFDEVRRMGVRVFLRKPFGTSDLGRAIEESMGEPPRPDGTDPS